MDPAGSLTIAWHLILKALERTEGERIVKSKQEGHAEDPKGVSRREFLKGATVGVAAASGASLLAGCGPQEAPATEEAAAAEGAAAPAAAGAAASCDGIVGYSSAVDWLGEPPAIADSDVAETVDVDVLVLGGGHAGLMASLSASEAGAKVAVIEKYDEAGFYTDYWHRLGEDIGHVNSQWLIDRGYGPYNTAEIVDEFVRRSGGRVNTDILRLYIENSGAMFDRMVAIYEEYEDLRAERFSAVEFEYTGDNARVETIDFSNMLSDEMVFNQIQKDRTGEDYPIELGGFKTWPTVAMFQGPVLHDPVNPFVSGLRFFETFVDQKTKDLGAEWYYEHTAQVLTQDASGAVTGAIASDPEGKLIRFTASKGVLVACGDFSANADMCWALINDVMEWNARAGQVNGDVRGMGRDGYGHKLCCWAGGMIEPTPRPCMGLDFGVTGPWGATPMLLLNVNAERFCDESAAPLTGSKVVRQPKGLLTLVTDAKYMDSITIAGLEHGGPNFGRGDAWLDDFYADMDQVAGAGADGYLVRGITVAERNPGTVYGASTLEELAGYLGYEGALVDKFVESIDRYNEMCYAGLDTDYNKDPKALIAIDEPPFYGVKGENDATMSIGLVTLAGMVTDNNLNVLNQDGAPIKGLYVAGNTLGGRYGLGYVTPFAGNSIGQALTHGWMAGKIISSL